MLDFLKNVAWKLLNICIDIVHRIVVWDCNDLFIVCSVIQHVHYTNRITANQTQGFNILRTNHQHIQWILVIT